MATTVRSDTIQYSIILGTAAAAAQFQALFPNGIQIPPAQALAVFNQAGGPGAYLWIQAPNGGAFLWDPNGLSGTPTSGTPTGFSRPAVGATYQGVSFDMVSPVGLNLLSVHWDLLPPFFPGDNSYDITWFWNGHFLNAPPPTPAGSPNPPRIGVRRWVNGFELPRFLEGGSGSASNQQARSASRTPEGMGYAFSKNSNQIITRVTNPTGGARPNFSYERFYIRLKVLGTGEDNVWGIHGSTEAGASLLCNVTAGGALKFYNKGNTAYPGTAITTTGALTLFKWYRVDLKINYNVLPSPNPPGGALSIYLNGVLQFQGPVGGGFGLAAQPPGLHADSFVGTDVSQGASNGLECDIDDWSNADFFDPTVGSHIQAFRPVAFGATNSGAFGSDWRQLLTLPPDSAGGTNYPQSNVPSSILSVLTDFVDVQQGCVAFNVGVFLTLSPTSTGKIGWRINGAQTLLTVNVAANQASAAMYAPGAIAKLAPLEIVFQKDAGVGNSRAVTLIGSAEYHGVWGVEDLAPGSTSTVAPFPGIHNAPFMLGNLSRPTAVNPPLGGAYVMAGVYVGNDLGQDVQLPSAPHWLWVRPVGASANGGGRWFSSMVGSHTSINEIFTANVIEQVLGSTQAGTARIATNDQNDNQNALAYQWVAVADPAMRYMLNGAFSHDASIASIVNALIDPAFSPDACFVWVEDFSTASVGVYYKGPGHTANQASPLNGAVVTTVLGLAAGSLTSKTPLSTKTPQTAFSAWRKNDGNSVATWFDVVSYVGNGAGGTRDIAVALGGQSPLFSLVVPNDSQSWFKDPSHITTDSSTVTLGTNGATSIVGHLPNVVRIGTTLNTNGVTYNIFTLSGAPSTGSGNPPGNLFETGPIIPRAPGAPFVNPSPPAPPIDAGCISLVTAINELAERLEDTALVHWTSTELQLYLTEALRVFNALTNYSRARGTFNTGVGIPFYDLPTVLPTLRGYNLKDQDLVTLLEYHLMEPPTPTAWTGTAMFSLQAVSDCLQRRLDRFLLETGIVLTRTVTAGVTPDADGRVAIPVTTLTLRRVVWTAGGVSTIVFRDDEWALNAYAGQTWQNPAAPQEPLGYSVGVTPPITMQLAPPPNAIGTLDTIGILRSAILNPAVGVLLGIPDDLAWGIKFGALSDLLGSPGPAMDPTRAAIAEKLWELAVTAAKASAVVLNARIVNAAAPITSFQECDQYNGQWVNRSAQPSTVIHAGHNLVGLVDIPDVNGPYAITLDVVRNMPIPVLLTDCFFEGGVGYTNAMLDYAQFLALFKEGPSQADAAQALLQKFLVECQVSEALDQAFVPSRGPILTQTKNDERQVAREREPESTE